MSIFHWKFIWKLLHVLEAYKVMVVDRSASGEV